MNKLVKSRLKRTLGLFLALLMLLGTEETAIIVNAASVLCEELSDTERGEGGFGSTGK